MYRLPFWAVLLGARAITEEHHRQINVLRESGLEWIAVCPPDIKDTPFTGNYQVKINEWPSAYACSRRHIADLMIKSLQGDDYVGKLVSCWDDSWFCTIL